MRTVVQTYKPWRRRLPSLTPSEWANNDRGISPKRTVLRHFFHWLRRIFYTLVLALQRYRLNRRVLSKKEILTGTYLLPLSDQYTYVFISYMDVAIMSRVLHKLGRLEQ